MICFIVFRLGRHGSFGNSPIGSIRDELVKSLASNKKKRDEIENSKRMIDSLQAELENLTKENRQLEAVIKNFEVSFQKFFTCVVFFNSFLFHKLVILTFGKQSKM